MEKNKVWVFSEEDFPTGVGICTTTYCQELIIDTASNAEGLGDPPNGVLGDSVTVWPKFPYDQWAYTDTCWGGNKPV